MVIVEQANLLNFVASAALFELRSNFLMLLKYWVKNLIQELSFGSSLSALVRYLRWYLSLTYLGRPRFSPSNITQALQSTWLEI